MLVSEITMQDSEIILLVGTLLLAGDLSLPVETTLTYQQCCVPVEIDTCPLFDNYRIRRERHSLAAPQVPSATRPYNAALKAFDKLKGAP